MLVTLLGGRASGACQVSSSPCTGALSRARLCQRCSPVKRATSPALLPCHMLAVPCQASSSSCTAMLAALTVVLQAASMARQMGVSTGCTLVYSFAQVVLHPVCLSMQCNDGTLQVPRDDTTQADRM